MKDFFKYVLATFTGLIAFSIISTLITIGIIGAIATMGQKEVEVKPSSVLHLKLQGEIVEQKIDDPFEEILAGGNEQLLKTGLNEILSCIRKAKADPNIKGIFINPGMFSAGMSTVEEIKDAIEDFKESDKFVISYAGNYTQLGYYLASSAHKVYMNPQGMLDLRGLSANYMFFKKAMDKLDIETTIFKVGKYKSAIEPFINEEMSPESKEQSMVLVASLWNSYKTELASERGIDIATIEEFAEKGLMFSDQESTLEYGLIDELKYVDQVLVELNDSTGKKPGAKPDFISVKKYAKANVKSNKSYSREKIALIYASGGIDDGSNEGINSSKLSETIRKARNDSNVKAIVLRVNSPGGSAFGSEQIWREAELAKSVKPVVVSMGDVAASGGYYISCSADAILARPTTITGSIGIFGMIPNFEGLTDKMGITFDGVKTNEYADLMSVVRPMTETEKQMLQNWVEKGYETFITRCADGRNTTNEAIHEVGQGRVWTGSDAMEKGLIDKFGGIKDAVELAAELAGIEDYRIIELPEQKDFFVKLMEDLSAKAQTSFLKAQLGEHYEIYNKLNKYRGLSGLQTRMPYDLIIQ